MTRGVRRVWITRAEPGAAETAARLEALGVSTHSAPVLSVEPTGAAVDLAGVAVLAFSSRNGIDAFIRSHGRVDLPVYAVGDATAAHARAEGFAAVTSADGDVAALARRIRAAPLSGAVLHLGPLEPAGDLVGALTAAGLCARFVAVYRTVEAPALDPKTAEALARGELTDVLVHSPRAATVVARLTGPESTAKMALWGLSSACLAPLASHAFAARASAPRPREDALIDALAAALGISPARR